MKYAFMVYDLEIHLCQPLSWPNYVLMLGTSRVDFYSRPKARTARLFWSCMEVGLVEVYIRATQMTGPVVHMGWAEDAFHDLSYVVLLVVGEGGARG